jgi:hypothetical protein
VSGVVVDGVVLLIAVDVVVAVEVIGDGVVPAT